MRTKRKERQEGKRKREAESVGGKERVSERRRMGGQEGESVGGKEKLREGERGEEGRTKEERNGKGEV